VTSSNRASEDTLISINRIDWKLSSKPAGLDESHLRGNLTWYNPYEQIRFDDVWDEEPQAGEVGVNTLMVEYTPAESADPDKSWAGIMQPINAEINLEDTLQTLEFRIFGDHGIVHVDIGRISEDINGNGLFDTEDRLDPVSQIRNGILDDGEDTGLDGLPDEEEPGFDESTNPDPNRDNWYYNGVGENCDGCDAYDYSHINGTEGNSYDSETLGHPDTEDLNRDYIFNKKSEYISFELDLADNNFLVPGSEYNGWKTYSIPLYDSAQTDTVISNPYGWGCLAGSNTIRLWLESPSGEPFNVRIVDIDLPGYDPDETLGLIKKAPGSKLVGKVSPTPAYSLIDHFRARPGRP
jgi:cell surface protein SprA